jgi:hypothetical protein
MRGQRGIRTAMQQIDEYVETRFHVRKFYPVKRGA